MNPAEGDALTDALLESSRALVGIALRALSAGIAPVTPLQHRVLVILDALGTASINLLADELGVDQSNASRHCSRLASLGLVDRVRSPRDRRALDVTLTPQGRRQVHTVRAARRRDLAAVIARLPDDVARDAVRVIEQFNQAAGADGVVLPVL